MDMQRAKEIAESTELIQVSYLGAPVVIREIEELNATAKVYPVALPDDLQTVPVEALNEEFDEPDLPFV